MTNTSDLLDDDQGLQGTPERCMNRCAAPRIHQPTAAWLTSQQSLQPGSLSEMAFGSVLFLSGMDTKAGALIPR